MNDLKIFLESNIQQFRREIEESKEAWSVVNAFYLPGAPEVQFALDECECQIAQKTCQ